MRTLGDDNGKMEGGREKDLPARQKEIRMRNEAGKEAMSACVLCPRACGSDRVAGRPGFCGLDSRIRVASCGLHWGEESVLVGEKGSGAIFFSGCNLGCVFCQNWEISTDPDSGAPLCPEELADIMLGLQEQGCANINLVTPTPVLVPLIAALEEARKKGLSVPVVYNTSAYERVESLRMLDGLIDIYMPDAKLWSRKRAGKYLGAADYPAVMRAAILEMHRQVGDLVLDGQGYARRGLLVRHLVMPGLLDETEKILGFLAGRISRQTYVNLMDQYRPCHRARGFPEIDRGLRAEEFAQARRLARRHGLERLEERDLSRLLALLGVGA